MQKIDLSPTPDTTTQSTVDSTSFYQDNNASITNNGTPITRSTNTMSSRSKKAVIITSVIAIVAGTLTGFGGFKLMAKNQPLPEATQPGDVSSIKNGDVFGSKDKDAFKDSAEGYLEKGGLEGEGSHHLVRPGGETQTVYITSSVTDLDTLEGMDVKVWGETFKGQKAGWLMDVGSIEVINTQGEKPSEE